MTIDDCIDDRIDDRRHFQPDQHGREPAAYAEPAERGEHAMTVGIETHRSLSDYSLVGEHAALAVERGLADAKWYASPIPKEKMRTVGAPRWPGGARHDSLVRAAVRLRAGRAGAVGHRMAIIRSPLYGMMFASTSDCAWHEAGHGTAFKTDWMNNAVNADRFVHGLPRVRRLALEPRPAPQRYHHRGARPEIGGLRPVSLRHVAQVHQHALPCQPLPERRAARLRPDDSRRAHLHPGVGVRPGLPAGRGPTW